MSDGVNDAESVTRNKRYTELDHLKHLIKLGYEPDSIIIRRFLETSALSSKQAHEIYEEYKAESDG